MDTYEGMDNLIREIDRVMDRFKLPDADMLIQRPKSPLRHAAPLANRQPDVVVLGKQGLVYRLGSNSRWVSAGTDVLQDPTEDCPELVLRSADYELPRIRIVRDETVEVEHYFLDNSYFGTFGLTRIGTQGRGE